MLIFLRFCRHTGLVVRYATLAPAERITAIDGITDPARLSQLNFTTHSS